MPNPRPRVGDMWRFTGIGKRFYYLVVDETKHDPLYYDADTVTLLSFTDGELPLSRESVTKMVADSKRWDFLA